MTTIQRLSPSAGRGGRALRRTTRTLLLVGDNIQAAAVGLVVSVSAAWMLNDSVGFSSAPVLNVSGGMAVLLVLAVWGAARLIENITYDIADRISPAQHDGGDLWAVTSTLQAEAAALADGADHDDIRAALQASQVLPALHGLMEELNTAYARNGALEESSALWDTTALLRAAAHSFGHGDIGQRDQ
ncbi:hypothetical protein [Streptomyces tsukubensis]|uniref:hypothetical protein n=1 Tax=Streptomyces tsukubensis TaxID=83656 RepID=UPI00344CFB79